MPRHAKPTELALHSVNGQNGIVVPGPNSSPMNLQGVDLTSFGGGFEHDVAAGLTPLPPLPNSPPTSPRTTQGQGRNFLNSFKRAEPRQQSNSRQGNNNEDERPGTSSMSKIYHLRKNPGSTPELSLVGSNENVHKETTEGANPPVPTARPQPVAQPSEDSLASSKRKDKSRFNINRTKSVRRDSDSKSRLRPTAKGAFEQQPPPNTAPLNSDWPGAESRIPDSSKEKDRRGKSAERAPVNDSVENLSISRQSNKDNKNFGKSASDAMSKGRKAIFGRLGKLGRSHSSHEKEIPDSEYQLKVINKPLVDQTRLTRISKQLSSCRDKTEYWMPSLPWRCIDYLNANAEEEGLYRIPGSGPKVKHWQRRFDTELDIDLLSEDVPDTNEIASMLKAWLREQPTEIMPMAKQQELAMALQKENPNYKNVGQQATQTLRDTLSELPPFNYYLLFAVTCHLSLLLANKERNKMDLNNLAVCVNPCLNLERWLFNYLVGDWRNCWQGCYTEKEFLEVEKMIAQGIDPNQRQAPEAGDERSVNSSMWATTVQDDASAVSVQSSVEDRGLSSGNGSAASRTIHKHDESRSVSRETSRQRLAEDHTPMTYKPAGSKGHANGNVGLGIDQDVKRPRTADQRYEPEPTMAGNLPPPITTKSRSNSTTPRISGHNRSRSDLPATPVKASSGADFQFPVRPS